jgi:hypothetical protein
MVRSSNLPFTRPTGAARFWACSAPTTWATPTPAACSASGFSSTVSSRSTPPTRFTSATPGTLLIAPVTSGSAMRVSSSGERSGDDSVSETMGKSLVLIRVMIGSFISGGRSCRTSEILSRMSCEASCRSFEKLNWTVMLQ